MSAYFLHAGMCMYMCGLVHVYVWACARICVNMCTYICGHVRAHQQDNHKIHKYKVQHPLPSLDLRVTGDTISIPRLSNVKLTGLP